MTSSIIENWSDIKGIVTSSADPSEPPGFTGVGIVVEQCEPVEDYANLLADTVGKELVVLFRREQVQELHIEPQAEIACRVRLAGPQKVYVHRRHIQVIPPAAFSLGDEQL